MSKPTLKMTHGAIGEAMCCYTDGSYKDADIALTEYEKSIREAERRKVLHEQRVLLARLEYEIRADERTKVLEEVNALIQTRLINNLALANATKYGNKSAEQQANSYATVMKYEIADLVEDLLDDLEELKEKTI